MGERSRSRKRKRDEALLAGRLGLEATNHNEIAERFRQHAENRKAGYIAFKLLMSEFALKIFIYNSTCTGGLAKLSTCPMASGPLTLDYMGTQVLCVSRARPASFYALCFSCPF